MNDSLAQVLPRILSKSGAVACSLLLQSVICLNGLAGAQVSSNVNSSAQPRIASELRTTAAEGGVLDVFILLRSQPQRQVLQQIEAEYAAPMQGAESEYRRRAEPFIVAPGEMQQAQDAIDKVVLQVRKEAKRQLEIILGPQQDAIVAKLNGLGAKRVQRFLSINALSAEIPAWVLTVLETDPDIAEISLVPVHHAQLNISTHALGVDSFWNAGFDGSGQSVAVLDTGLRTNHPAFAGLNIVSQVFLQNGSQDPCFADDLTSNDNVGHGTHVSGIIASRGEAIFWPGYFGSAKGLSTLYNLKVGYLDCNNHGILNTADVAAALDWAILNTPVKSFNYSAGASVRFDYDVMAQKFDYLADAYGLTIVVAAGNDGLKGSSTVESPGIGYNVITVAAMDDRGTISRTDDVIASFSSRGPTVGQRNKPDIAAPGTNTAAATAGIYSTAYNWDGGFLGSNHDFIAMQGTSMAAPHIAGAAALLHQAGVRNALAKKAILLNTTDTTGWYPDTGWGYANLTRAYSQLNYFVASLNPRPQSGDFQLYRTSTVPSGSFSSTLVWNRHIEGNGYSAFNDLNLYLYDASTSNLLNSSTSALQNVEQVTANVSSNVVLKVTTSSTSFVGVTTEPFAVAVSQVGMVPASGPVLSVVCSVPQLITPNSTFTVTCTATNNGDVIALNVLGNLIVPARMSGGGSVSFGTLNPSASSTRTWSVGAGSSLGQASLQESTASASFGETFSASTSFSANIAAAPATVTLPASTVSSGGATLNGTVNPNGATTAVWFDWSATNSFQPNSYSSTSTVSGYNGIIALPFAAGLTVLISKQTYYYRAAAQNTAGIAYGQIQSFTTSGIFAVSISPSALTFSPQLSRSTSPGQQVTLTNTGNSAVDIGSINISSSFLQTNTCGTSLAVGNSCTVTVFFWPSLPGTSTGTLVISDNANGSPHIVTLTGTGTDLVFFLLRPQRPQRSGTALFLAGQAGLSGERVTMSYSAPLSLGPFLSLRTSMGQGGIVVVPWRICREQLGDDAPPAGRASGSVPTKVPRHEGCPLQF